MAAGGVVTVKVKPELDNGWVEGFTDDVLAALARRLAPLVARTLHLGPGDALLLEMPDNATPEQVKAACEGMELEFPGAHVVATSGFHTTVVRREDIPHAT
jgi:hypothetical protein